MSKRALGRGIDALLGGGEQPPAGAVATVAVSALRPNAEQPRRAFPEESLQELARSIEQKGVLQPILVEDSGDGSYLIVAGERRYRAAAMAGLEQVPVIVGRFSEVEKLEIGLIENLQREDLSPIEEARGYRRILELSGLSQEELAARVGKSRPAVANSLRLLKLPPQMVEALDAGSISAGHARAILALPERPAQEALFRAILSGGLSVREAERWAAGPPEKPRRGRDRSRAGRLTPELASMEERLIEALGTKVAIRGGEERGRIEISYFSREDLQRLWELLLPGE